MASVKWNWTADYVQACNCDGGCPCNWNAKPTYGHCHGIGVYKIRSGRYGDVIEIRMAYPGQSGQYAVVEYGN